MSRTARTLLIVAAALVVGVMLFGRSAVWLATDGLWFSAVGLGSVFRTTLLAQVGLGVVGFLAAFAALQGNALVAIARSRGGLRAPRDLVDNPIGHLLRRVPGHLLTGVVSAFFATLMGLFLSNQWSTLLLFLHGGSFGWTEPVLGHDASFYVFTVPLLQMLRGALMSVVVLCAVMAASLYVVRGAIQLDVVERSGQVEVRGVLMREGVRQHLAALVCAAVLLIAVGTFLARYDVLYDQSGLISGPGAAEVGTRLPLLLLQSISTLVAAPVFFVAIARSRARLGAVAAGLVFVPGLLASVLPGLVQRYRVEPNELQLESEHIASHIEATRHAFRLDAVEERDLSGTADLTWDDIQANQLTLDNVRLWDHKQLLDTFSQVQEIRTYYDFANVDNDRYIVDGELRQVMMSPRELVSRSLPDRARTWVNESMTYTHGYGVALGPVNEVTDEGLPQLWVKDLPPQVSFPDDLRIDRPELYYGEEMDQPVFVGTDNREFDYPTGDGEAYTTYDGGGGVPVGGVVGRSLWSLRLGSSKVFLSTDIRPDSRVLLHRDVVDRVHTIAPFLGVDSDPYLVIVDGRLVWVLDGFTGSDRFPYAQAIHVAGWREVNYLRSSVKITVDAYSGETVLYALDEADPILAAWRGVYPELFRSGSEMSDTLRAHLRYPQDAFEVQARLFASYHMTEPQVFYNREDEWEIPAVSAEAMEPYYTVMKLPGESAEEFIVMLPFVPKTKQNLAAWMVSRNDGDAYGSLRVYSFPKDRLLYGPAQVALRFEQDAEISPQLTLWKRGRTEPVLGTMLVIPIEESLIYVQPLYLQANASPETGRSSRPTIPELKRVIVGYGNRVVMEPTLDAALRRLFDEPAALPEVEGVDAGPVDDADLPALAWEQFRAADEASRSGDWAAYGVALDTLERTLRQLAGVDDSDEDDAEADTDGVITE